MRGRARRRGYRVARPGTASPSPSTRCANPAGRHQIVTAMPAHRKLTPAIAESPGHHALRPDLPCPAVPPLAACESSTASFDAKVDRSGETDLHRNKARRIDPHTGANEAAAQRKGSARSP